MLDKILQHEKALATAAIVLVAVIVLVIAAVSSKLKDEVSYSVNTYLSEEDYKAKCETVSYQDVIDNPDAYEGKFVKITGQVIQAQNEDTAEEDLPDVSSFEINTNQTQNDIWWINYSTEDYTVKTDDYLIVYGEISGTQEYQATMETTLEAEAETEATITIPSVDVRFIETTTYETHVEKAQKTLTYENVWADSSGCTVAVTKVEFCESQTRIYLTVKNNSGSVVSLPNTSAILVQGSKQINPTLVTEPFTALPEEIQAGETVSGVMMFNAASQSTAFAIKISGTLGETEDALYYEIYLNN